MVQKHIRRKYNIQEIDVHRPSNEYIKIEINTYPKNYTKIYTVQHHNTTTNNAVIKQWLSWTGYGSKNEETRFEVNCPYNIDSKGEYRIDVLFANNDDRDMDGFLQIYENDNKILDETITYTGDKEYLKRITNYQTLEPGEYTIRHRVPVNSIFLGCIIRKVESHTGDNIDSIGTDLAFTGATISQSSNTSTELNATILYDDNFTDYNNPSGYIFNHRDEINIYTKDENNKDIQIFGGYLSSVLPDTDFTKLTITAKDRLSDGDKRYILEQLVLIGGDKEVTEYFDESCHDFTTYGECLKYLCDVYETGLFNNISENYLVSGETYQDGFTGTFGSYGTLKTPVTTGINVAEYENYVFFRNESDCHNEQIAYIWSHDDYNVDPVEITDYPNFYIVYGLKDPKTETSSSGTGGGWQNDGKSADGSQIMAIGKPSAAGEGGYAYNTWWKSVFECVCPGCGCTDLRWAQGWADGNYGYCPTVGHDEGGSIEGHIFCMSCDRDYSCILGKEHISNGLILNRISGPDESSEEELTALKNGSVSNSSSSDSSSSGGNSGTLDAQAVLDDIGNEAAGYSYCSGCSTYECMASSGCGECWAMSDMIFKRLSNDYGVSCRILQYGTSQAWNHRSVQYKDANGEWTPFPYRDYGVSTNFNDTPNQWNGSVIAEYEGRNLDGSFSSSGSGSGKTIGYDKDKPFKFTIALRFCIDLTSNLSWDIVLNFTVNSTHPHSFSGLKPVMINNTIRRSGIEVISRMEEVYKEYYIESHGSSEGYVKPQHYYLKNIKFICPNMNDTFYDDSKDDSSCKMDIYGFNFNDGTLINPTDLGACGKTIKSILETLIKTSGYRVNMNYNRHRCDDIINFSVDNQTEPVFTAHEGVDSNILNISSIAFNPINKLFNNSLCVYKYYTDDTLQTKYYAVSTNDNDSVLEYGELSTIVTSSDEIHTSEAYYNARHSDKYNPVLGYTYTIEIPGYRRLMMGDLVKVVADDKKINDIQKISSLKTTYNISKVPRIQMTIGLGEMEQRMKVKNGMQDLINSTKLEETLFSKTAELINDKNVYQWDD